MLANLVPEEERDIAEIIADMFIEDGTKVEYDEFIKCNQSYHSFVELWWQIRVNLLEAVSREEPEWERKINLYS